MQLYVAYKVSMLPYFGNFSGTGAGKTLSAVLASRVITGHDSSDMSKRRSRTVEEQHFTSIPYF